MPKGRKPTPLPISEKELKERYLKGETAKQLAQFCGVSRGVIERRLKGVGKRVFYPSVCQVDGCVEKATRKG